MILQEYMSLDDFILHSLKQGQVDIKLVSRLMTRKGIELRDPVKLLTLCLRQDLLRLFHILRTRTQLTKDQII